MAARLIIMALHTEQSALTVVAHGSASNANTPIATMLSCTRHLDEICCQFNVAWLIVDLLRGEFSAIMLMVSIASNAVVLIARMTNTCAHKSQYDMLYRHPPCRITLKSLEIARIKPHESSHDRLWYTRSCAEIEIGSICSP